MGCRYLVVCLFVHWLALIYGFLILTVSLVSWLFKRNTVRWKPERKGVPPACLTDSNWPMQHSYIKLKTIKLHYVEAGDRKKTLMLFIHGFPEFWYSWRYQLREFQKEYWVVAVDMRGYGDSEKPKGLAPYKLKILSEDIRELIHSLGREKSIIVAHDWGGIIAWDFVEKYSNMVEKFIIMDAPQIDDWRDVIFTTPSQFLKSWYVFFFHVRFLPELLISMRLLETFQSMVGSHTKNIDSTNDNVEAYTYTFGKPGALTPPINYYRANFIADIWKKKVGRNPVQVPGLYVFGELEKHLSFDFLELSKKHTSNLRVEIIKGANHFVNQHKPDELNKLMWDFLKQ